MQEGAVRLRIQTANPFARCQQHHFALRSFEQSLPAVQPSRFVPSPSLNVSHMVAAESGTTTGRGFVITSGCCEKKTPFLRKTGRRNCRTSSDSDRRAERPNQDWLSPTDGRANDRARRMQTLNSQRTLVFRTLSRRHLSSFLFPYGHRCHSVTSPLTRRCQ